MRIGSIHFLPQFAVKSPSITETGPNSSSGALPNFSKSLGFCFRSRNLGRRLCLRTENEGFEQIPHGIGEKDAIIIVDHGSRRKESNLMLTIYQALDNGEIDLTTFELLLLGGPRNKDLNNEFVTMFRQRTGYEIVEPAHMELAEPSIRNSFDKCVQLGASRVIVSPFFLFPGRHWHQDIPSLTAEAAKEHSGVSYIITAPLGLHELLVDVVNDRIKHCVSHVAGDADECAVCVGTGKCRLY